MRHDRYKKDVSVIIPTHNRKDILRLTLDALSTQNFDLKKVEVIVVADGCTDGTLEMLNSYRAPFDLNVLEQERNGPGSARNYGASVAKGCLLLFLDDDVVPGPALIEEHVKTHIGYSSLVVIGYIPLVQHEKKDFFYIELRSWWENIFHLIFEKDRRFKYSDLLGGNFSIEKDAFSTLGSFNHTFLIHEDSELGMRIINAGIQLKTNLLAKGTHYDETDQNSFLSKRVQDGRADVMMVRIYPEILRDLQLSRFEDQSSLFNLMINNFVFRLPRTSDGIASLIQFALPLLESIKLRQLWRKLFYFLHQYWWLRGVAEEVGTKEALDNLIAEIGSKINNNIPRLELDLSVGLERCEELLDRQRPDSAIIRYGKHPIGTIPAEPGAEPLRGVHLRPILAGELAVPYLMALAIEGEIVPASEKDRIKLSNSIWVKSFCGGKPTPEKIWSDRYNQWRRLEGKEAAGESEFWEIQGRIRELENQREWVKQEWLRTMQAAEEKEKIIKDQQTFIQKLHNT